MNSEISTVDMGGDSTIAFVPGVEQAVGSERVEERKREFADGKFVRDIVFSNVPIPFQKARTYLWLVILTRALGAEGFGVWSLFLVTLSSATTISTLNCGSSLMRFLSGEREGNEVNQAFTTVLAMVGGASVLLAVLFVCVSGQMSAIIFKSSHARSIVLLLAAALVFDSLFEELKNLLRARRMNRDWAYLCLARLAPETLAVIGIAVWLRSVTAAGATYLAVGVCSVAGGILYLAIHHGFRVTNFNRKILSKYALYGLPLLPGVLASTVSLGADKYLVSYYLGLKQVGIYSACFAVSALVFFLTGPINDVLFPELSALYDMRHSESFRRRFAGVQKFVLGFAVGAAAILAAFPHETLRLVAPRDFGSGGATLAILGVQGIFMAMVLLYVVVLNVRMRVWSSTIFWLLSGIAIIAMDTVLLPRLGIKGAAISQLIVTAAGAFTLVGMHWKLFRDTFEPVWLLQTGATFVAVYAFAILWRGDASGIAAAVLKIGCGTCVFLFCLLATRYVTWSELRVVRRAIL
ncbi:MAG: lipopolysaccharide biosynthesis protein [Candidatus Acidiferrales bacterium]